ncbi:hypothetical protein [Streptomyces flavofungini]|uniref:Uncharacterized protein n=1 Tax=Streptomyces flavofungini TaxID=68200 RepID=A0ABS0XIR3_9ACTN|nr:hypothetical protein [Streptomyces flavofungini]MBJ3813092.1 hypothetical protein [Streptomyces flavofungini]
MSSPHGQGPAPQDLEEIPQPAQSQPPSANGHEDDDQPPPSEPGTDEQT